MQRDEWTLEEGILDVLRFLGLRLPIVAVLWVLPVWAGIAPLTHLPNSTLLTVIFTVPLGMICGAVLTRGLTKKVNFTGWIPAGMAAGAAAIVVIGGAVVIGSVRGYGSDFTGTLVPLMGLIGAGAAVFWFTMADE